MGRDRIISDVESVEEAKKVEETVKTGYVEPVIESVVHWIGVEEDLASSYEELAKDPRNGTRRAVFVELVKESKKTANALAALKKSLDGLDAAQVERIDQLKKASDVPS